MQVPLFKTTITGRVLARFSDMPAQTTTLPILRGGVARLVGVENVAAAELKIDATKMQELDRVARAG